MAVGADGLAALDGVLQGAVEQGGGDLLLKVGGDVTDGFEEAIEMKAGLCRGEDHRRVIEKEQMLLHPFAKLRESGHDFGGVSVSLVFAALDFFLTRFADG